MSVVVAHEVRRCPVPSPNLDDLGRLVGRTGRPAVHAQPVTYYCTHDNSSQGSYPAACTFPRIGGRGRRHRRGIPGSRRRFRARPSPVCALSPPMGQTVSARGWVGVLVRHPSRDTGGPNRASSERTHLAALRQLIAQRPGSRHEPSRKSPRRSRVNRMSSKVTAQPSPVGDWASKPIETGPDGSSIVKRRIIRHVVPSKDAWYAKAWSMRETRSHTERASTTNALASSATPRLTTETTMGSRAGEYSKQSLAQCRSSIHSSSTPASNVEAKSTVTRALSWKSPVGGTPSNLAALSMDSALSMEPAPGSMKMSLCGSAVTVIVPAGPSIVHASPEDGVSGKGTPGAARVVI